MMRSRRRDAGISMILVVILILITLGLVIAAAILFSEFKQKERIVKALEEQKKRLEQEGDDIKLAITRSNEATGLPLSDDGKLQSSKASEAAKKWRDQYFSTEALDRYPLTPPLQGAPTPIGAAEKQKFDAAKAESAYMRTLQEMIEPAAARTYHVKNRMEQLQVELAIAQEQTKNRTAVQPEIPKRKEEEKAKLSASIGKLNEEIAKENTHYGELKAKYTEERSKAEGEIAEEAVKFAKDDEKLLNEIRERKRQLEELKVKEIIKHEITFVHGKVLKPDVPNKVAFIDIGSRERVVPGLKFLVGRRGTQGRFEVKGKIEVKKAWMTYSEVSIIELVEPQEKPITEGDHIVNPLFSKERPVVMAFVGEDRPIRLRYSVDEASRRIREIGSEVRKEVSLDVDFVVFTEAVKGKTPENYEPFKKAVFLEIPIAEASDVFRFLGD